MCGSGRTPPEDKETLEALGTGVGAQVPWEILRLLPEHVGLLAHAQAGEADLFALSADELAA